MATTTAEIEKIQESNDGMNRLEAFLMDQNSTTYTAYYNG